MIKKVYKFGAAYCSQCPNLDRELARIEGGIPIEVVDYGTPEGEALATSFGVRGLPTLVKTSTDDRGERVIASLAGYKYSRATFEEFLECSGSD